MRLGLRMGLGLGGRVLVGVGGRACAEGWGDEEGDGCGGGGGEEGGLGGAGGVALAVALSAGGEGVFFVDAVGDVSDFVVAEEDAVGFVDAIPGVVVVCAEAVGFFLVVAGL